MKQLQQKKALSVRFSSEQAAAITAQADRLGMSLTEYFVFLHEFYELQHMHLLIKQFAALSKTGFTHIQIAQLSALFLYLEYLKSKYVFS